MSINLAMPKSGATLPAEPASSDEDRYPTTYIDSKESLDLPDEGTMTVRFKKLHETSRDEDGEKSYSCTLELREIVSVDGSSESEPDEDTKMNLADFLGKT